MRRTTSAVLLISVVSASLGFQVAGNDLVPGSRLVAQRDLAKLQGIWVCVHRESRGMRSSLEGVDSTATYEGDQLILKNGDQHYRLAVVTLDPGQSPKAMNTWDQDGPNKDKTFPGIYEVDGDTLKVCFSPPGEKRPTEFSSTQGGGFLYCVYERRKP